MFNIREEVVPIFNIKEFGGDIYIIDDMFNKGFPAMFLGFAPDSNKMYTFNCSDVKKGKWAEYVVFETTFDMVNRSSSYVSDAREVMKEASAMNGLYVYVVDSKGYYDVELNRYEDLYGNYIPKANTYYTYNKSNINSKKC